MMPAPYNATTTTTTTNTNNNNNNNSSHQQNDNDTTVVPSNPTLAILSGYGVTIWECLVDSNNRMTQQEQHEQEQQQPITRYPHGDLPISTLAWNHNRMVLATASDVSTEELDHPNIVLTSSQTGHQLDSFQHNQLWNGRAVGVANSVYFGGKSRYLCIGDETGAVCLWDLKKRLRVRQFFHDGYPSRQVSLDPTDTYVLSLSPEVLTVYNLRDGILLGRMVPPPAGQAHFTKFHVSPLQPKIVAAGTTDGSVLLFDVTNHDRSSPYLGLMRRHSGPVTGVAFSPIDPNLLLSCGEDGTVMVFDVKTGETIQQLCALSTPINSVSVHSDGTICAVGCESGQVLLYDMRRQQFGAEKPISSLQVDGPVKQIQFAPPLRAKDRPMMFRPGTGSDHGNPVDATPAKFRMGSSPPSSSTTTTYGLHVKTEKDINTNNGHHAPPTSITTQRSSESSTTYGAPPQAYAGPPGSTNNYHNGQLNGGTPTTTTTIRNTDTNIMSINQHQQQQQQPRQVLSPTRSTMSAPTGVDSISSRQNSMQSPNAAILGATSPQTAVTTSSSVQQQIYGRRQQQQQQQQQQPSSSPQKTGSSPSARIVMSRGSPTKIESPSKVGSPGKIIVSPSKTATQPKVDGSGGINVEQVRDIVREEVENLQDDVEEQLRNLHMDLIAQFHQQSQEISKHLETINLLIRENQQIRDENEKLRRG